MRNKNININKINNKMNKLKFNKTTNVLRINNNTYIPFQLHQLPKKYEEFPLNTIIKLKGYIYICTSNFKNSKNIIDIITHNKQLTYKNSI